MTTLIRVGLLDFDADVRGGMRMIIEANPGLRVFFDSDGKAEDIDVVAQSLIDVLIVNHRLSMGSGIDFYDELRRLTGFDEAPSALLTCAFELPELRLAAFRAGFFDVVSLEVGLERLVTKALEASSGLRTTSLVDLHELVRLVNPSRRLDIPLNQLISNLPEKYQSNLRRLKTVWNKIDSGKAKDYDLADLSGLLTKLGFQTPEEAVIRMYLAGHLDAQ